MNFIRNRNFRAGPQTSLEGFICPQNSDKLQKNKVFGRSEGGVILFSVTSLIEKTILLNLEKSPAREHYLSTTFLAFCLFMFVVSSKGIKPNLLSKIGERDSLYIYVFHPLLLMSLSPIIKTMPYIIGQCYNVTAPLVVLFVTIVFIVTLRKIKIIK